METENGGSAFPEVFTKYERGEETGDIASTNGMTLRDYFAAKVLAGIHADGQVLSSVTKRAKAHEMHPAKGVAKFCYEIADAMIEERKK